MKLYALLITAVFICWVEEVRGGCDCNCKCQPNIAIQDGCCPHKTPKPCAELMSRYQESFKNDPKLANVSAKSLCVARNFAQFMKNNTEPKYLAIKAELVSKGEWKWIDVPLKSDAPFPIRGMVENLDMSDCELIEDVPAKALVTLPKALLLLREEIAMFKRFLYKYDDCHDGKIIEILGKNLKLYRKYLEILEKIEYLLSA